jgi:hypothetical protein
MHSLHWHIPSAILFTEEWTNIVCDLYFSTSFKLELLLLFFEEFFIFFERCFRGEFNNKWKDEGDLETKAECE